MSDLFQFVSKETSKIKKDTSIQFIDNPILFTNSENPEITFLVDKLYSNTYLYKFYSNVLRSIKEDITCQFLYVFNRKPSQKEMKTNIGWFYYDNSIDLSEFIPEHSNIITVGSSLYSVTYGNTDLQIDAFYDFIFNKTYFYIPLYKRYAYPINDLYEWNGKDNFERFFALKQIKLCIDSKVPRFRIPALKDIKVEDTNKFLNKYMSYDGYIALDTETTGLDFVSDEIFCLTLAFESDPYTGYYLRWEDIDLDLLDKFLERKIIMGQSLKFDFLFFKKYGLKNLHISEDTLNLAHCLNEMRSNSLKTLAWLYSPFGGYEQPLENYKRKYKNTKYSEIEENTLRKYACADVSVTMLAWKEMIKQLKWIDENFRERGKWSLEAYYRKVVLPAVNLFVEIEYEGVFFDWEGLEKLSKRVKKEIEEKKKEIADELGLQSSKVYTFFNLEEDLFVDEDYDISDEDFDIDNLKFEMNIDSNEIIGKLFEEKGLPCHGRNKKGIYNVNDETLKKWSKSGFKIANLILDLHKLNVLFNMFIGDSNKKNGYFKYRRKDNKLHPSYAVCLTNSGRNRCKFPNLMQIPERGYLSKEIKECFISPSKDYYKYELDLNSAQLRIGAILSGDKEMWDVFTSNNPDLHSKTGYSVLRNLLPDPSINFEEFMSLVNSKDDIAKYMRQKAKACFVKGTELLTNRGWMKIEDIIPELNKGFHTPYFGSLKVIGRDNKEKDIESTYYGVANEFIEFELENGDKLPPVTLDHIVIVNRNNKEIKIEAKDVLLTDSFTNIKENFLYIKRINKIKLDIKESVYCLSVKDHELIIKSEKGDKYLIGNCNFQLEFGASAFNFAKTVIETDWSEEECDNYIKKNNLQKNQERLLSMLYRENKEEESEEDKEQLDSLFNNIDNKELFSKCWCIASEIRKRHFETYSGLFNWIEETKKKTQEKGYVKSVFGTIRRLPQLLYISKDSDKGKVKNLLNICLNTGVQAIEIAIVHLAMIESDKWIKENKIDGRPYNMIHDSYKAYVHKDIIKEFDKNIVRIFERDFPEYKGLPITVESSYK